MLAVNNRIRKIFENPKTTVSQKKKLCKSLAEQFNEDQLPEWCTSPEAYQGEAVETTLDHLEGGRRRRRRQTRRKITKRRRTIRRRSKK
jgi:hypothetical protein